MALTFGALLFFALLVLAIAYGKGVHQTTAVRMRMDLSHRVVSESDIPREVLDVLRRYGKRIEELGFESLGAYTFSGEALGDEDSSWGLVYREPRRKCFATIQPGAYPTRAQPVDISFLSISTVGQLLETVSFKAHLLATDHSAHEVVDAKTISVREQWEKHQEALDGQAPFEARDFELAIFVLGLRCTYREELQVDLERGRLVSAGSSAVRCRPGWALELIRRGSAGEKARLAEMIEIDRASDLEIGDDSDVVTEVLAHRRRQGAERNGSTGWGKKLAFFVASVTVFALGFGVILDASFVLILVGVLFFHEFGHALAMRLFGYRDLQILFIPFLGAVASGENQNAKPWQEIVVLFAGPVPGIIAGTAIFTSGLAEPGGWLYSTAMVLLGLNYLNLLPLVPLDGGRVMNIVLFDRFPRLQIGFAVLGALGMIAGGTWIGDSWIRGIGIALLFVVPIQYKTASVLGRVLKKHGAVESNREQPEDPAPDATVTAVYSELRAPRFDSWNSDTKFSIAKQMIGRIARPTAGWKTVFASAVAYLVVFTLPVGFIAIQPEVQMMARAALVEDTIQDEIDEVERRLEAAISPLERAQVHLEISKVAHDFGRDERAHAELAILRDLQRDLSDLDLEASMLFMSVMLEYYSPLEGIEGIDVAEVRTRLDRAMTLRTEAYGATSERLVNILYAYPEDPDEDLDQKIERYAHLARVYEVVIIDDPSAAAALVGAYQEAGRLLAERGRVDEAERSFEKALTTARGAATELGSFAEDYTLRQMGHLYVAQQDYLEAERTFREREAISWGEVDGQDGEAWAHRSVASDRAWMAYWQGELDVAEATFSSISREKVVYGSNAIAGPIGSTIFSLATVSAARGDEVRAIAFLTEARKTWEASDLSAEDFERHVFDVDSGELGGELGRRVQEQVRLLEPLLARM